MRVLFDSINVSQFFKSFPLDSSDSSCLKKSLISSSHLFLGLPTNLFVLTLLMRPGFHSAAFLDHRSSAEDAIHIAFLHFIFLCASIQQRTSADFIRSPASFVLLFQ